MPVIKYISSQICFPFFSKPKLLWIWIHKSWGRRKTQDCRKCRHTILKMFVHFIISVFGYDSVVLNGFLWLEVDFFFLEKHFGGASRITSLLSIIKVIFHAVMTCITQNIIHVCKLENKICTHGRKEDAYQFSLALYQILQCKATGWGN